MASSLGPVAGVIDVQDVGGGPAAKATLLLLWEAEDLALLDGSRDALSMQDCEDIH